MKLQPNTRSCIIPDPGMALVEVDQRQADAQVVAWEADDAILKSLFRRGLDIYTETETGSWADPHLPADRQTRKNCVHSVDYGAGARTLADRYIHDLHSAEHFIHHWLDIVHPPIREWHRRVAWDMRQGRTPIIRNVWGFRRIYACEVPITQPLAWIGQSTVSITTKHMKLRLADEPDVELLLDGHDSILFQLPRRKCPDHFEHLLQVCAVEIPFPTDPLTIPCEIKWSLTDWGHMQGWTPDAPAAQ